MTSRRKSYYLRSKDIELIQDIAAELGVPESKALRMLIDEYRDYVCEELTTMSADKIKEELNSTITQLTRLKDKL